MTLLGLADVAEPHILDDYEISAQYRAHASEGTNWFADQIRTAGLDPADFAAMFGSPRPAMRKTLEGLREMWGDHRAYARSIGLGDDVIDAARRALRTEA